MLEKEYRAINITMYDRQFIINKLKENGIQQSMYRINNFSTQKEIVAEKKIYYMINDILEQTN